MNEFYKKISVNIKDLRIESELTQKSTADTIKVKLRTYIDYEGAKCRVPVDVLIDIAAMHGVSLNFLLGLPSKESMIMLKENKMLKLRTRRMDKTIRDIRKIMANAR